VGREARELGRAWKDKREPQISPVLAANFKFGWKYYDNLIGPFLSIGMRSERLGVSFETM
jgi:hypothetical protein